MLAIGTGGIVRIFLPPLSFLFSFSLSDIDLKSVSNELLTLLHPERPKL